MLHHIGRRPAALTCTLAMLLTLAVGAASAQSSTDPIVAIDSPAEGAHVSGIVQIAGWAAHTAAPTGTGVDALDVYLDGPAGTGQFLGRVQYGASRVDAGTYLGNARFTPSGFSLAWNTTDLSAGVHALYVYVHSTVTGWSLVTRRVVSSKVPAGLGQLTVIVTGSGTGAVEENRYGTCLDSGSDGAAATYGCSYGTTVVTNRSVEEGSTARFTAIAHPGSRFVGWSGDEACGRDVTCSTRFWPRTLTATFEADVPNRRKLPLTVLFSGSGSGTVRTGLAGANADSATGATVITVLEGTTLRLAGSPGVASTFGGFTSGCDGQAMGPDAGSLRQPHAAVMACSVQMSGPRTVTATFDSPNESSGLWELAVRILSQGTGGEGGSVTFPDLQLPVVRSSATATLRRGRVRVKAIPDPGFELAGWGGDADEAPLGTDVIDVEPKIINTSVGRVTLYSDLGVTAYFKRLFAAMIPLTVQIHGTGTHEVTIRRPGSGVPLFHAPDGALVVTDLREPGAYELEVKYGDLEEPLDVPADADRSVPGTLLLRATGVANVPKTWKFVFGPKAGRPTLPVTVVCGGAGRGKVRLIAGSFSRVIDCHLDADVPSYAEVTIDGQATEVELRGEDQDDQSTALLDKFGGWGGDCLGAGLNKTCRLRVSGPIVATAAFNPRSDGYTLVLNPGPGGAVSLPGIGWVRQSGSTGNVFPASSPVQLTAAPDSGYSFIGWGRDCSGTELTCTVTFDRNRSVTTSFARRPYTSIDSPLEGASVTDTLTFGGWAFDSSATEGTGIDAVHVYFGGPAGQGTFLGAAALGGDRPDVAAYLGLPASSSAGRSGVSGVWKVPSNAEPGKGVLYVYFHSLVSGWSFVTRGITIGTSATKFKLTVLHAGTGSGRVTSNPAGISTNGGSSQKAEFSFDKDVEVALTAQPDSGSTFEPAVGWSGDITASATTGTLTVLRMGSDRTVTATFTSPGESQTYTLTVTVVGNGLASGSVSSNPAGISTSGGPQTATFAAGTIVRLTALPSSTSIFAGWTGALACMGSFASTCTVTMNSNLNLTATFDWPTLTVTHAGTGAGSVKSTAVPVPPDQIAINTSGGAGVSQSARFMVGTSVNLKASAAAGSTFAGFAPGSTCIGFPSDCTVFMNGHASVTATFNKTGGGVQAAVDTPANGSTVTGAVFVTGWAADTASTTGTGVDGVHVYLDGVAGTGQFLGVSVYGGPRPDVATHLGDARYTPSAFRLPWNTTTTTPGLHTLYVYIHSLVSGWSFITRDVVVAAETQSSYTLTVTHTGNGSGSVTSSPGGIATSGGNGKTQTATITANQSVTMTVTPAAGSVFSGWTTVTGSAGSCTGGTTPCVLPMAAATSLQARFDAQAAPQNFALMVTHAGTGVGTVTSAPAGISTTGGTSVTQSISLPAGTLVTLTATASAGSTFGGWGGVGCAASPCNVTMNANVAVTATFTLHTFTLTVTKQGQGAGTVVSTPAGVNAPTVPSASFPANQNVTLSAIPAPGSLFDAWGGACAGVARTSPCTLTMTTNLSVTATFIVNPVP